MTQQFNPTLPFATTVSPDSTVFLLQTGNIFDEYGNRWASLPPSVNGANQQVALTETQIQYLQGLSTQVYVADPTLAPYYLSQNTPDCTSILQGIINALHAACVARINAGQHACGILYINDLFNISSLYVPGTVSLIGRSSSETGFLQIPGSIANMVTGTAYQGVTSAVRRQQYFTGFRIDGQGNGNIPFTAVTDGSTAVLSVTGAQLVQPGYIIEAIGIPKNDASGAMGLVTAASKTTNQITLSTPTVGANGTFTKALARQSVTVTCTADGVTGTLLCSNTTGVLVGMKCYGANLQTDQNDLNQWSIVTAVVPNTSITVDLPTATAGSFACQFFVGPCGLWLATETQAPNYNSNLNYEGICISDVRITNVGFHGIVNRGRAQMHAWAPGVKTESCGGYGFTQTGASDTWCDHLLSGNNWWAAANFSACATPRWKGEYYDTYLHDRYAEVMVRGCRYWHMENSDINGSLYVVSSNNTTHGIAQISNCNFLVNNSRIVLPTPWGTIPNAYVTCNGSGTVLQVSGGTFAADDNAVVSNSSRYNYLASSQNGGVIFLTGMSWADFPTSGLDNCPYSIAICDTSGQCFTQYVQVSQSNSAKGRLIQSEGNWSSLLGVSFQTPGTAVWTPSSVYATWSISNGYGTIRIQLSGTLTTTGASGNFQITGCPLVPNSADNIKPLLGAQNKSASPTWGTSCTQLNARMNLNGGINLEGSGPTATGGQLTTANFTSGASLTLEIEGTFKI